jgi:COMPASS component BRE2
LRRERIAIEFKGQEYFESVEYPQSKEMISLMDVNANKAKATSSVPTSTKKSATVKNLPERGRGAKPAAEEAAPVQELPTLHGSQIVFFVNGKCQGVAFQDLYDYLQLRTKPSSKKTQNKRKPREGMLEHTENPFDDGWLGYYPFISLFNGAEVSLNTGPNFDFPPPPDIDAFLANDMQPVDTKVQTWRPVCERYSEFMAEQWAMDAQEEAAAQAVIVMQAKEDEAERKAALRREKKRISEQKRRQRKAEEVKASKLKEKMEREGMPFDAIGAASAGDLPSGEGPTSGAIHPPRSTPLGLLPFLAEEGKMPMTPTTPSSVELEESYGQETMLAPSHSGAHMYTTPEFVDKHDEDADADMMH